MTNFRHKFNGISCRLFFRNVENLGCGEIDVKSEFSHFPYNLSSRPMIFYFSRAWTEVKEN